MDERTEALIDTKKGRKEQVHGEYSKAFYCLSWLANRQLPARELVIMLFGQEDKAETRKKIRTANNYKLLLKKEFGDTLFTNKNLTSDDLVSQYMNKYSRIHWDNTKRWLSLTDKQITFYRDVCNYWATSRATINGQKHSWYNTCLLLSNSKVRPNGARFIKCFCGSNKNYTRSYAQQYLIYFNNKRYFTNDDIYAIINGTTMTEDGFFRMLSKIRFLTRKK